MAGRVGAIGSFVCKIRSNRDKEFARAKWTWFAKSHLSMT